ncbi:MAG: hypothetical protein Q4B85_02910 [Lachnospiraceae bacterium]|nr:hypothetical protein [Lachnospiraceae bacterium]
MYKEKRLISVVIRLLFFIGAAVLLGISLIGKTGSNWPLAGALFCTFAGNLINIYEVNRR